MHTFSLTASSGMAFAAVNTHTEVSYFPTPWAPWFRSANISQCKFPARQETAAIGNRAWAEGKLQFQRFA